MNANETIKHASTAFSARFDKGLNSEELALFRSIATVVPSTSASTGYGFLSQVPKVREWVGDRHIKKLDTFEYEIKNKLFESTIAVPRTDFEDNDYGKYGVLFEDYGREADEFPNEYIFGLLTNGTSKLCLDEKPFFSDDHFAGKDNAGSTSNLLIPANEPERSTPWYLLDTSRAIMPLIWQERVKPSVQSTEQDTDSHVFLKDEYLYGIRARGNAGYAFWQLALRSEFDLNKESFSAAITSMTSLKGESGRPLRVTPTILVVPPSLRQKAHDVINREFLESGESNINFKIVEIMVTPYL